MGLLDVFKGSQYKREAEELRRELERCQSLLTPELKDIRAQEDRLAKIKAETAAAHEESERLRSEASSLGAEIEEKKKLLVTFDDELMLQEFGLYEPRFDFTKVDQYKNELKRLRDKQKDAVRSMKEQAKHTHWTVNNSAAKGRKMVGDITRLLIRAFNGECDETVRKIKFSNIDASIKSIQKSADIISKLGRVLGISVPQKYVELKKEEAYLSYEYAQFKQQEKERLRELREQEREEAKLRKEIAEQRKKLAKERKQYEKALADIDKQIAKTGGKGTDALNEKRAEIVANIGEVEKAVKDVDYREANQKAGYVYIISNIGSFGEGVYKIGMTRRLDPMERVSELGDASVPFKFDVHAMIFTEDAPGLEKTLHREFEDRKINKVNKRREFFRVTLDEIKDVVHRNYDKTVEFVDLPDAEHYRISKKMEGAMQKNFSDSQEDRCFRYTS